MRKTERLRKRGDFAAVYQAGRRVSDRYVVLYARRNGLEASRVGFAVGRRVGKAVERNRVRRRLREVIRLHASELPSGWDWIVAARGAAAGAGFRQLEASVLGLIGRVAGVGRKEAAQAGGEAGGKYGPRGEDKQEDK